MHFKVIVPFYNVENWITKCIKSIKLQNYKNFQCILIDDCSTDKTVEKIKNEIKNDERFHLIENNKNVGALENIYNGILYSNPSDEDIIVNIDGDDWLARQDVFEILKNYYQEDIWMTYGSHIEYPSGVRSKFCMKSIPDHIINKNLFRESEWMTSALRTFKYKLWKKIKIDDLKNNDDKFYESAWDLAYMFPMLEMSGNKSKFIKEIIYVYNLHNYNDHVVPEKRTKQLQYENEIRKKKKYERLT